MAVAKVGRKKKKKEEKGKGKSKLFSVHVFGYKKERKKRIKSNPSFLSLVCKVKGKEICIFLPLCPLGISDMFSSFGLEKLRVYL